MSFRLLDRIEIPDGAIIRRIALYEGSLTALPKEHSADILVVSAFPNDYTPTETSLIGSLYAHGLSVRLLAETKAHDLRATCAFWISNPIKGPAASLNIRQIACFEPDVLGSPPAVVGNLFRGLFPFLDDQRNQVVAMPLLASGDQGYSQELMFRSILDAAAHWLARGLAISELKNCRTESGSCECTGNCNSRFQINIVDVKTKTIGRSNFRRVFELLKTRWQSS
jgi:hypothetical protein